MEREKPPLHPLPQSPWMNGEILGGLGGAHVFRWLMSSLLHDPLFPRPLIEQMTAAEGTMPLTFRQYLV